MYRFTGWSDGGAAEHNIATPSTPTTFTANYQVLPLAAIGPTLRGLVQAPRPPGGGGGVSAVGLPPGLRVPRACQLRLDAVVEVQHPPAAVRIARLKTA